MSGWSFWSPSSFLPAWPTPSVTPFTVLRAHCPPHCPPPIPRPWVLVPLMPPRASLAQAIAPQRHWPHPPSLSPLQTALLHPWQTRIALHLGYTTQLSGNLFPCSPILPQHQGLPPFLLGGSSIKPTSTPFAIAYSPYT